jgi:F-type H+-transporting ATPase subunit a
MEQLALTAFLNHIFGQPVLALLRALHISVDHPNAPISNSFAMELLVAALMILFFIAVRLKLSVEQPNGLQHTMEGIYGFVSDLAEDTIPNHPSQYVSYLTVLGLFILLCNLIGLVPGLEPPTAVPIVPLGCALFTWFYYHYHGVRENGPIGYLTHFIGPQEKEIPLIMRIFLPILMFPIELFSHLARIMSLTVRLFANMFAGEMVTLVFFSLIPLAVPLPFEALHIGVSFIQTYIFVLLAAAYLGEATAHGH